MKCYNKGCVDYNKDFSGNCSDAFFMEECEELVTQKEYQEFLRQCNIEYLEMINWKKKSNKVLNAVRKAYIKAH